MTSLGIEHHSIPLPGSFNPNVVNVVDTAEVINEWAPQMGEHALFLYLLLKERSLEERALSLFHRWRDYVCAGHPGGVAQASALLSETIEFKTVVLTRLQAGEWIGSAFPQLVEHIRLEALYFQDKLNGIQYTPEQEVAFWNRINSEHAGFAAHYLDPSEEALVDQADATMKAIRALPIANTEVSIVMALEAGANLTTFNLEAYHAALANKLKSVINPTLLRHVIREGQIESNVLSRFVGQQQQELIVPDICATKT